MTLTFDLPDPSINIEVLVCTNPDGCTHKHRVEVMRNMSLLHVYVETTKFVKNLKKSSPSLTDFLVFTAGKRRNQSTDSTEGQEIEDTRQHKRSDKVT